MKECSKSISRWLRDSNFTTRYFRGRGIDIGGRPDPLALYRELFPLVTDVLVWDRENGDAQHMAAEPDAGYDFVFSSHCLEHISDPAEALRNWLRILKPGGHMIVNVPDEDLYEQGVFPSTFNADHSWTFTIWKPESWSGKSVNLFTLLPSLGPEAEILRIEQLNEGYRFGLPRYDQSMTPVTSCAIEFVIRRRPPEELERKGRLPSPRPTPNLLRVHLNQYRNDRASIIAGNAITRPFEDDREL